MPDHDHLDREPEIGPDPAEPPALDFEERGTPEQLAALYGALAEASTAFAPAKRTKHVKIRMKSGETYEYDYAPLSELIDATRPALGAAGVFIMQPFTRILSEGIARIRTIVSHKAGARLLFTLEFVPDGDVKEIGSKTTYARRYAYQSTTGVDAGELDADDLPLPERGETGSQATPKNRQPPTPQKADRPKPAPKADSPKPTPAQRQADMERTLSTPVASNGSGAPVSEDGDPGPEPPADLDEPRVELEVPEDIRAMDDRTLTAEIGRAAAALFGKAESPREAAQKRCIELTGHPKSELGREGLELLLAGFRADMQAA